MEPFDFSEALRRMREGRRVRRLGWNDATFWLQLNPNHHLIVMVSGARELWGRSERDILATDWVEVPDGG